MHESCRLHRCEVLLPWTSSPASIRACTSSRDAATFTGNTRHPLRFEGGVSKFTHDLVSMHCMVLVQVLRTCTALHSWARAAASAQPVTACSLTCPPAPTSRLICSSTHMTCAKRGAYRSDPIPLGCNPFTECSTGY